ncbi:MAG: conserved membrane protein of unknown function [Candidatus Thorarchaeota archaeon]|nr:MAG: conserved membrane protein of unknown function [Candidatus Thorarchaeota archaeon]
MATCSLCGAEDLCFTCPYCRSVYCAEHRLPESHGCPALQLAKEDARRKIAQSFSGDYYEEEESGQSRFRRKQKKSRSSWKKKYKFSQTEVRDLTIATILVALVGLALMAPFRGIIVAISNLIFYIQIGFGWYPIAMIGIFVGSFLLHELAHKFTAQRYGMWSEFRMLPTGYFISIFSILASIPIVGTGVVLSSGAGSQEEDAKTNLAGPMSNFILALILIGVIVIFRLITGGPLAEIGTIGIVVLYLVQYGVILNAFLGLFNMIPFQPFDGATVMAWDKRVWAALTISLLIILIMGYIVIPMFLTV